MHRNSAPLLLLGFAIAFSIAIAICNNNLVSAAASSSRILKRDVQQYSTKYDNIDVNQIVNSRRLMVNYANCLLEKGPCTPEGRELKTYLPEAIATNCTKCSDRQKEISGIVLANMVHHYRDLWDELLKKYDPDGTFRKQYEGTDDDEDEEDEGAAKK